ncbi:tetratricopeptide repeat protein [Acidiphilium acidophilum]|uniref:Tetratricopeptide repeat protein n=1 Tax=Acidiphilium acidophilum TaxID=76588 RepID=A0AAW9DUW9_ACIAO|nr:tetratricopeptide repeat protein [Acidiphilium acidophilum]MDX5932904.1 tetratricopeptide repeat protein [Acidiphilium acidophilum]GBR74450.1 hypothetical protein AA700_0281 [Acidiphilium acidophilum DSM 700]
MSVSTAEILFDQGNAYAGSGDDLAAAAAFGDCVALSPMHPGALRNWANALRATGQDDAAIAAFQRYLALVPGDVDARFALGTALMQSDRLIEAVQAYVACVRQAPDFGAAYVNLAGALRGLGVLDHATQMAVTAVHLMPENIDALACLAGLHFDAGGFEAAIELYGRALALAPGHAGLLSSLANALHGAGAIEAALLLHERAYAVAPEIPDYRHNRALCLLAAGDFERGWAEYEWRLRRTRALRSLPDRGAAWRGEPIAGRTILLYAEQGLGDTIQFIRYVPLVAALGAHVVLAVPPTLVRLAAAMPMPGGSVEVIALEGVARELDMDFDLHCPLMSLPWCFGTRWNTIPATVPYITAPRHEAPTGFTQWVGARGQEPRPLVGVVWAGGSHRDDVESMLIDRRRSLPVTALAALAEVDGVRFVSLQKDPEIWPDWQGLFDPMEESKDFMDTAAIVARLDLVITVDTAVAHLAGAMGKTVWMISRFDGCWRWGHRQVDTPWYPTMRIFRQQRDLDWTLVVADLAAALQEFARNYRSGAPVISTDVGAKFTMA